MRAILTTPLNLEIMEKVTLKNKRELIYKGATAQLKQSYVELAPRSKTKRTLSGGFRLECYYVYNGNQSKVFNTIKAAKEAFANEVDGSNDDLRKLLLDLCDKIEAQEKKQVFFSEELDDILGLNVFK